MDVNRLASRLGLDEDEFLELVDLFVSTSLSDIEKMKKGLQEDQSTDVAAAAHSIKGAAGNLGFDDMFEMAKDMEMMARQEALDGFAGLIHKLEDRVKALVST